MKRVRVCRACRRFLKVQGCTYTPRHEGRRPCKVCGRSRMAKTTALIEPEELFSYISFMPPQDRFIPHIKRWIKEATISTDGKLVVTLN